MTEINIFSRLLTKIFYERYRVLHCAVALKLYFDSHCHSLRFGYTFRRCLVHKIRQLGIPK